MKNEYEIRGELTAIFLRRKDGSLMETIIDTNDLPLADSFPNSWCAMKVKSDYYAYGQIQYAPNKGRSILLHRWIMGSPKGMVIDHINHDKLDNRRSDNLREATVSENGQNRRGAASHCISGVRGVTWDKVTKQWQARLRVNGKNKLLGRYNTIDDAERVVKEARAKYFPFSQEALAN